MTNTEQERARVQRIFTRHVRQALADKGLTQAQLGELAGLTESSISNYLSGKRAPTLYSAALIAKALRVSLNWLCGFKKAE